MNISEKWHANSSSLPRASHTFTAAKFAFSFSGGEYIDNSELFFSAKAANYMWGEEGTLKSRKRRARKLYFCAD
jgi:hypothetical protein